MTAEPILQKLFPAAPALYRCGGGNHVLFFVSGLRFGR